MDPERMRNTKKRAASSPPYGERPASKAAMPLVLVVDDDRRMRRHLRTTLVDQRFRVVEAETGAEALAHAAAHNPDLVLLDFALPDLDGLAVTTRLREWTGAPIFVLSMREHESDKIAALDAGANDYLTKPFGTGELLARMRVWLRQIDGAAHGARGAVVDVGDLRIDFGRRLAFLSEREVHLTPTEYKLFGTLMKNAGKVLTHEQILVTVWGPAYARETQYLRVYMGQLRQKLEKDPARPRYLVTEAGVGYRLRTS
jgi:two-component system KDP operon response regulator KdpE